VRIPVDLGHGSLPPYTIEDSPSTLLGTADLVFIDPLGTGHSRAVDADTQRESYSIGGDARQFGSVIRRWLKLEGRFGSPKYLLGESYGTMRAPFLARELLHGGNAVALNGIALLGQAVNLQETAHRSGNVTCHIASLPMMAAVAWYHGVGGSEFTSAEQATQTALYYAFGDYASVLLRGSTATAEQADDAAARLAAFTGIDAGTWRQKRLRISKGEFRRLVLRGRDQVTGSNDARYVATAEDTSVGEPNIGPPPASAPRTPLPSTATCVPNSD
jgi:carboxypeptidase C (cathepsin A)